MNVKIIRYTGCLALISLDHQDGENPAEELHRFRINKKIYLLYKDEFEVKKDLFWNRVSSLKVKIFPLFGGSLMTKEEFNQYLLDNFETLLSEF